MQIIRVPVGAFITNCYIAEGQEPGRGFLVDPADNPKKLISILEEKQICPEAILLTHGHYDHILAVPKLQERWKEIPVYCNAKDIPESLTEYDMGQQFPTVRAFKNVKTIEDGQELVIAGTEITVMETPGHTPGGCSYYVADAGCVFSGDTLFAESVGRSDFPGGSTSALVRAVKEKLFLLPDDTLVCPGHGEETTIGHETVSYTHLTLPTIEPV